VGSGDDRTRVYKRKQHGSLSTIATSASGLSPLALEASRLAPRDHSRSERRALPEAMRQGLTADGVYNYVYDAWNP